MVNDGETMVNTKKRRVNGFLGLERCVEGESSLNLPEVWPGIRRLLIVLMFLIFRFEYEPDRNLWQCGQSEIP